MLQNYFVSNETISLCWTLDETTTENITMYLLHIRYNIYLILTITYYDYSNDSVVLNGSNTKCDYIYPTNY